MTAGVFRVTQIYLDEDERVSGVLAVADDATAGVIRALAGGGRADITGRDGLHAELSVVWMPRSTFLQVMNASGRIPEDDPQYRPGLTGSLARIHHGLMTGEQ